MLNSCPISIHRIDAHFVRLVALQVIIVGFLLLITENIFFSLLLLFDFLMRTLKMNTWSPFAKLAKFVILKSKMKPKLCDEAPKRFALYMGLVIIGFLTLFIIMNYALASKVLLVSLLICAFLEAAFDYCVGCKIFYYIKWMMSLGK